MLRKISFFTLGLALLSFAITFVIQRAAHGQAVPSHPSINIGTAQIVLNSSHVNPIEGSVIRAFVPTGSVNPNCFATFGDSNFPQAGNVIYCVPRQPTGLGKGVVAVIFFPAIPPGDVFANITLFQEGALSYGTPVLCNVEGC